MAHIYLLVFIWSSIISVESACDMCTFAGSDSDDCRVYGQIGDRNLIPWYRASQECLDEFQIKDEAIDPDTLSTIFPDSDGVGGSVNGFVNYLKFNSGGTVVDGIKASFSIFFAENENDIITLRDKFEFDGTSYDCSACESSCYDAMKKYFSEEPGSSEMVEVGKTLYLAAATSREKEQSFVRIRLCNETATSSCEPLASQVTSIRVNNSEKACSAYGLGPAGVAIPGCNGTIPLTGNTTSTRSSSNWVKLDANREAQSLLLCSFILIFSCDLVELIWV
jgi:hypothetical protein